MSLFSTQNFSETFVFKNKEYSYNRNPFNNISERAIEVPIGIDFLQQNKGKKLLEVGNVLTHYETNASQVQRDILDKFEVADAVLNIDLMDFNPIEKYDAIISLSTVEHIGQSTDPTGNYGEAIDSKDKEEPLKSIIQIYNLLKVDGKALISVPFGSLSDIGWLIQFGAGYLDLLFSKYKLSKREVEFSFFKKIDMELTINPRQFWEQCSPEELSDVRFHQPFPFANGIAIIEINRNSAEDILIVSKSNEKNLLYLESGKINNLYFSNFHFLCPFDNNGWIHVNNANFIFYGPYVTLSPGKYQFSAKLDLEYRGNYILEMTYNYGQKILWRFEFICSSDYKMDFAIEEEVENVEIRLININTISPKIRVPILNLNKFA